LQSKTDDVLFVQGAPGKEYANDNVMLGRSAWAGSQVRAVSFLFE
jgi:hypothetical protein